MEAAEAVLRFLESAGRRSEAEFYLALFQSEAKERFAVISVDAPVARQAVDAVVQDLSFLRDLGLTPLVVLGLVEPKEAVVHAARLGRRLERAGVASIVLAATPEDALADHAAETVRASSIPIVPFDVRNDDAEAAATEERFSQLGRLLTSMHTRKLIFLNRRGALIQNGAPVSLVNLSTEFDLFSRSKELSRKQRLLLQESRRIVFDRVPHKLLVTITSPFDLLRELFTIKGAGTLLRRGSTVDVRLALDDIDLPKMRTLLENSFRRRLVDTFFERPVSKIILERDYRGAAIVCETALGAYLTKFAVEPEAQGEGVGRDVWEVLDRECASLFWRARPENPITGWYTTMCDGLLRTGEWNVFWKRMPTDRIPEAITYALAAPVDLLPLPSAPE